MPTDLVCIDDAALGCPANQKRIWRRVAGCESAYAVSNDGYVLSIERKASTGHGERRVRQKLLKRHEVRDRSGKLVSLVVKLSMGPDAPSRHSSVARLILDAFIGVNEAMVATFKDGNPANVVLENIEWSTFTKIATKAVNGGYGATRRSISGEWLSTQS